MIPGYMSRIYATGQPIVFTGEATTPDDTRTIYSITNQAKRYWDLNTMLVVEADTGTGYTLVPESNYSVEYCGGRIVFKTPMEVGTAVRVSGAYRPYAKVAGVQKISMKLYHKLANVTTIDDAYESSKAILKQGDGSLTLIDIDPYMSDQLGGTPVLIVHLGGEGEYQENITSGPRWEMYIHIGEDAFDMATGELTTETVSFRVMERHYRRV